MSDLYGFSVEDLTFARMLALKAAKNGAKRFMHYIPDGRNYSYEDIHSLSSRIANGFLAHGLKQGDRVAVLMENCPEQVLTFFALGKIGVVFAPLNPAARGTFLEYYVNHSNAIAIVVEEHLLDQVREIAAKVPQLTRAFVLAASEAPCEHTLDAQAGLTEVDFAELYDNSEEPPELDVKFSDLCSLMYTSGTTGPSKGNMFSQVHTMTFGMNTRRAHWMVPDDVVYCVLPLFHAGAWNTYTCGSLLDDGQIALARRFSVSRFWEEIRDTGSTVSFLSAVTHFLEAQDPCALDREHGLRLLISGPTPQDPERFKKRFGVQIASNYGLTDYCLTHALGPKDPPWKMGSCGSLMDGCSIRIVDDNDFEVPAGVTGEIVLRNDRAWTTSLGYYNNPGATAEAFRNSWFHTGDRGCVDEDGYLWFRDRKKDALRRRGENISASEVEGAILQHPDISEAAVYGIKAEGTDDEVAVSIVLRDGRTLAHLDFIDFCGKNLPYFVVPRFVEFIDAIPRTLNHKVQKVRLREAMQENWQNAWDREAHGITFSRKRG